MPKQLYCISLISKEDGGLIVGGDHNLSFKEADLYSSVHFNLSMTKQTIRHIEMQGSCSNCIRLALGREEQKLWQ